MKNKRVKEYDATLTGARDTIFCRRPKICLGL